MKTEMKAAFLCLALWIITAMLPVISQGIAWTGPEWLRNDGGLPITVTTVLLMATCWFGGFAAFCAATGMKVE